MGGPTNEPNPTGPLSRITLHPTPNRRSSTVRCGAPTPETTSSPEEPVRARILLIAACVLLAVFAYDGVVRLLLIGLVRLPKLPAELNLLTSILALFSLTHAWYSIGGRLTLAFFGLSAAIAWAYEQAGVATGLVFGAYHYTDYLGPKLGERPVPDPAGLVHDDLPELRDREPGAGRPRDGDAGGGRSLVRLAAVSAVVMTAWDLVVDPILSGPSARAWIWDNGGPYFGIPIQNFRAGC